MSKLDVLLITPPSRIEVYQKLSIRDPQFHGAWGVNITWSDGHNAGIYTFQFLREIAESYLHSGLDLP